MPFNDPIYKGVRAAVQRDTHLGITQHPDTVAVNHFAEEMAAKMAQARAKGRDGWETCPPDVLSRMLREHVEKGDPRDVANFCMMLWHLGQPIAPAPAAQAVEPAAVAVPAKVVEALEMLENGALNVAENAKNRGDGYDEGYAKAMAKMARETLDALAAAPAVPAPAADAATTQAQMGDSPASNVETLPAQARIVLDGEWSTRLLDGRPLVRDEMGFGDHPDLPLMDEGMKPRAFFDALGIELKHTMAEDDLDTDEQEAMNDAGNWNGWAPQPPAGEGWKLVAIFDTEDGTAAWWLRDAYTIRDANKASAAQEGQA